jgi:hypothetical protein
MEKKSFTIGILSLTAVILVMANYFASPQSARADLTIKDRDFGMVTARTQASGDALYILDNRSGRVAVFSYDPSTRTLQPRGFGDMGALFQGQ